MPLNYPRCRLVHFQKSGIPRIAKFITFERNNDEVLVILGAPGTPPTLQPPSGLLLPSF